MSNIPEGFEIEYDPSSIPEGFEIEYDPSSIPEGFEIEQPKQYGFLEAFEDYRTGRMDPQKAPHFEELMRRRMSRMFHDQNFESSKTPGDIAVTAMKNTPGSLVEEGKNIWSVITSPLETVENVAKAGGAFLQSISPDNETKTEEDEQYWDAISDGFIQRYGSRQGFIEAIEKEPVSVLMDLAGLFTAGGGLLSKVNKSSKLGPLMTELGEGLDMFQNTGKVAAKTGKGLGAAGAKIVEEGLGITTGTSGQTIKHAKDHNRSVFDTVEEKFTGAAPKGAGFEQARKGETTLADLVQRGKNAVAEVHDQKANAFRDNLADMGDITVDMDRVTETISEGIMGLKIEPTGPDIKKWDFSRVSPNASDITLLKTLLNRTMNQGGKAGDLTPEGMLDLRKYLKQAKTENADIKALRDKTIASIDETLMEIPGYKKLRDQDDLLEGLINEFEGTLGITPDKSAQEVGRKLVAAGAEDVGFRGDLLHTLETMTESSLAKEIAGLEMRQTLPGALLSRAAGGAAIGGVTATGLRGKAKILTMLAGVSSPRLMGKLLYQYGYSRNTVKKVVGALKDSGLFDQKVTTFDSIIGRMNDDEENVNESN